MKRLLFVLGIVFIGIGIVAGSAAWAHWKATEPAALKAVVDGTASTPDGELPLAKLELSIYPQPSVEIPGPALNDPLATNAASSQGWPFFWPSSSIELPANSLVQVTIHQYDSGGTIYNPWLAKPQGIVEGSYTINGKPEIGVEPTNVAHTFTIHMYPEGNQPYLFVSVPVPAQPNNAPTDASGYPTKPIDVTFTFRTGAPGTYVWNCEFPCGTYYVSFGGPMSQRGYMSGTVTVV